MTYNYLLRVNTNANGSFSWQNAQSERKFKRGDITEPGELGVDARLRVTAIEEGSPARLTVEVVG